MTLQAGDGYVAMGSSFAAGPGLGAPVPGAPRGSGRSLLNYAHLVAADLDLDLTDVSLSGATIAGLLHGETSLSGRAMPPQVDALTPDTRLVTITGGGNDVGYIGRVMLGSLPAPLSWLPPVRRGRREFNSPEQTDSRFAQLERDLRALVTEIRRRSPRAQILLVDYLSLLPPDPAAAVGRFPAELADWARGTAARLAALTESVGTELGCPVVRVAAASAAHHAWSAEPWTRRLQFSRRKGAPYHPTRSGMRAVAELVIAAIT
ncbi:MAG TPA: SGNH/GDSL hydrolase family protein [Pseudolysinimonas sp.]|nr:SGNH/GDSL hydrolase family protein [Pseudolysinimonas sp.]